MKPASNFLYYLRRVYSSVGPNNAQRNSGGNLRKQQSRSGTLGSSLTCFKTATSLNIWQIRLSLSEMLSYAVQVFRSILEDDDFLKYAVWDKGVTEQNDLSGI